MGDEDDRVSARVQLLEERHDLASGLRVQVSGRLVGEEDRRIVDERPRDRDALTLSAGELVRLVRHPVREAHGLQRLDGPLAALAARQTRIDERELDLLQSVRAREQVERLKHEADLLVADRGKLVVGHPCDLAAVENVGARRGRVQTSNQIHEGRLAGSRRTHDGHVLPAGDPQRDAGESMDLLLAHLVHLGDVPNVDQHRRRTAPNPFIRFFRTRVAGSAQDSSADRPALPRT